MIAAVVCVLTATVIASFTADAADTVQVDRSTSFWGAISQCSRQDIWPCLKSRSLTLMERIANLDKITLMEGVTLEREEGAPRLEHDPEASSRQLDDVFWSHLVNILQSFTLRIKMLQDNEQNDIQEGRGKLKKMAGPLLMALMMKKMMAAMAMAGLALLAGKALLVSKLAFTLSLIVALKKLLSGGGSTHETYEIVAKHPHHDGGSASNHVSSVAEPGPGYFGHRRGFEPRPAAPTLGAAAEESWAQMMAYRGYQQPSDTTTPTK